MIYYNWFDKDIELHLSHLALSVCSMLILCLSYLMNFLNLDCCKSDIDFTLKIYPCIYVDGQMDEVTFFS